MKTKKFKADSSVVKKLYIFIKSKLLLELKFEGMINVTGEKHYTHAPTHPRTHAPTHPRTHAPTHPRTHAPTHPRAHAPTHPHTYAPTRPPHTPTHPQISCFLFLTPFENRKVSELGHILSVLSKLHFSCISLLI